MPLRLMDEDKGSDVLRIVARAEASLLRFRKPHSPFLAHMALFFFPPESQAFNSLAALVTFGIGSF